MSGIMFGGTPRVSRVAVGSSSWRPIPVKQIFSFLARGDDLPPTIAKALKNGRTVVLLDANFSASLKQETINQGISPALAEKVINIDHHNEELGTKTATELAFDRLEELRAVNGDIQIVIDHGDTDSLIASYVVQNMDRVFTLSEKSLLIAAARSGDHFEGEIESDVVRLDLALSSICFSGNLFLWQKPTEQTAKQGIERGLQLIDSTIKDTRSLYTAENKTLWEEELQSLQESRGATDNPPPGVVEINDQIVGFSIVIVDVGKTKFNPRGAYASRRRPLLFIAIIEEKDESGKSLGLRARGVGRHWAYPWLQLTKFYPLLGQKITGRDAAGGRARGLEPKDAPTREEVINAAIKFLEEQVTIHFAKAVRMANLSTSTARDLVAYLAMVRQVEIAKKVIREVIPNPQEASGIIESLEAEKNHALSEGWGYPEAFGKMHEQLLQKAFELYQSYFLHQPEGASFPTRDELVDIATRLQRRLGDNFREVLLRPEENDPSRLHEDTLFAYAETDLKIKIWEKMIRDLSPERATTIIREAEETAKKNIGPQKLLSIYVLDELVKQLEERALALINN